MFGREVNHIRHRGRILESDQRRNDWEESNKVVVVEDDAWFGVYTTYIDTPFLSIAFEHGEGSSGSGMEVIDFMNLSLIVFISSVWLEIVDNCREWISKHPYMTQGFHNLRPLLLNCVLR